MPAAGPLAPDRPQAALHLSSFQIGFLISAQSIGSGIVQMPAGLIVDFAGVRRMLTFSVMGVGLLIILFSRAESFPAALAVLLLYGAANSFIGPASSKCVMDRFPTVGRATAMAVKQTGVNFGAIFAGILLPAAVALYSWRQSLLFTAYLTLSASWRTGRTPTARPGSS